MPGTAKSLAQQMSGWGAHVMFAHHGRAASNPEFLGALHREGVKTCVYLCDEPYESGETCKYSTRFNHVFSMDACTVEAHRKSRTFRGSVHYLPPGVDTSHFAYRPYFDDDGELIRKVPAFFLGNATLVPRQEWLSPIERLVEGADIRFFRTVPKGDPRWVPLGDHPKLYAGCVVGLNVHRAPEITMQCFKTRVMGRGNEPVPAGLELPMLAPRREGTGFWNDGNLPASHVNPRFLEMAACGTLVVSDDHRSELARMFPMAPRAESPEHFFELVQHFINNPRQAEEIGRACSTLVSRRHTYRHRAAEVLIQAGFRTSLPEKAFSSLGEPADWLTPQDCSLRGIESFSGRTGPSERWSPQLGMSLTRVSGRASDSTSLDAPTPWL